MGDVVVVMGAGVMGSQCGQLAQLRGAETVFAVDIVEEKLALAQSLGMRPIDSREEDPGTVVRSATRGRGADIAFAAVGGAQSHMTEGTDPMAQAVDSLRSDGTIVQVGHLLGELTVSPQTLRAKSIDWIHPRGGMVPLGPNTDAGELAARLVAEDRLDIDAYITHEESGLDAFERVVEITNDKADFDALGPAQIVLS